MVINFSVGKQLMNALLMMVEISMLWFAWEFVLFSSTFKRKWLQSWEGVGGRKG